MVCRDFILPEPASYVSFFALFNLRNLLYLIRKLTQLRHKQQQLKNRAAYYENGDRRKRAHHLITRGAAIESVAPLTKVLTETEFYSFAEKVFDLPEVKGLLMEAVNKHNRSEQKEGC